MRNGFLQPAHEVAPGALTKLNDVGRCGSFGLADDVQLGALWHHLSEAGAGGAGFSALSASRLSRLRAAAAAAISETLA